MVLGLDRPTSGSALISGQPYSSLKGPLHHVGALLDAKDVHPGRTARAHLRALAQSNGIPKKRVDEVLEMTGLSSVAKKRIKGFSLGMSQRLGIAATMLGDPEVLMFDEPVNGLDPEGILWIRTFMRALATEGRTIFVSSHLMSEMAQTADHLIVIGRGKLLADVSTKDFIGGSATNAVRVRSPHADKLVALLHGEGVEAETDDSGFRVRGVTTEHVGDLAAANSITLHELVEERASLEAAFMEMTHDSVDFHAEVPAAAEDGTHS
jgi:ABC-2 type transport system ATP-binding protein